MKELNVYVKFLFQILFHFVIIKIIILNKVFVIQLSLHH